MRRRTLDGQERRQDKVVVYIEFGSYKTLADRREPSRRACIDVKNRTVLPYQSRVIPRGVSCPLSFSRGHLFWGRVLSFILGAYGSFRCGLLPSRWPLLDTYLIRTRPKWLCRPVGSDTVRSLTDESSSLACYLPTLIYLL